MGRHHTLRLSLISIIRFLISIVNLLFAVLTAYSYENRKVKTVNNGKTHTKTFDAWDGVKLVQDPVSSIEYSYYSVGKPKEIKTGGATVSMKYDAVGNQSSLTDPNAGTYTYSYDAAGRTTEQVDGSNKKTVNKYDTFGRLATTTINGITTTYTYGTSGYDLHRLTKVQAGNNYFAYTHDKYGRTLTDKQYIDGSGLLEFTYGYNAKGQLSSTLYPGNLQVNRQYDAYGNVLKVLAGTQAIWESIAATGTVYTSQLGGTLTATKTYNAKGLLTNQKTVRGSTVLHDMTYDFDGTTGNLNSRLGMQEKTEYFKYDNMDRLTKVDLSTTNIMNIDYKPNGNINTKTSLGQYGYDSPRPHAVTSVDNTGKLISTDGQKISYTAFNKVSAVREKIGADSLVLNFTYGPDKQRWKTELKKNNILQKTIIFGGNYETVTENGTTKQLYYISGGDGVAAIYVKQSGQADKIYYPHTDHLGSIVKLTDGNGSEVFRATYDAWGEQTVRNNTFAFPSGIYGT